MIAVPHAGTDGPLARRVRTAATLARLALLYLLFSVLKRGISSATLARWAWREPRPRRGDAEHRALQAVIAIRRRFGHDGDCLESALVLYRELSRTGASPRLVMGFAREAQSVVGHAWVEVNGQPVGEDRASISRYAAAARFGPRGEQMPA